MSEYINIKVKKEDVELFMDALFSYNDVGPAYEGWPSDEARALQQDIEKQVQRQVYISDPDPGFSCIVLGEGEIHDNQCGGYACLQNSAQGTVYPICGMDAVGIMTAYFTGHKWNGWCSDGIDEEAAVFIEMVVPSFSVDRDKMKESCEAWVHGFFENKPAILIWENSD